jgi:hypothetical protein
MARPCNVTRVHPSSIVGCAEAAFAVMHHTLRSARAHRVLRMSDTRRQSAISRILFWKRITAASRSIRIFLDASLVGKREMQITSIRVSNTPP